MPRKPPTVVAEGEMQEIANQLKGLGAEISPAHASRSKAGIADVASGEIDLLRERPRRIDYGPGTGANRRDYFGVGGGAL